MSKYQKEDIRNLIKNDDSQNILKKIIFISYELSITEIKYLESAFYSYCIINLI